MSSSSLGDKPEGYGDLSKSKEKSRESAEKQKIDLNKVASRSDGEGQDPDINTLEIGVNDSAERGVEAEKIEVGKAIMVAYKMDPIISDRRESDLIDAETKLR